MRHTALISELEACVGDNAVRVVLLTSPRGAGLSATLKAFVEEVRGRGDRADLIDCERVGVQEGGAVDALLRARLTLGPAVSGPELIAAVDAALPLLDGLAREFLAFAMGASRDDFRTARLDARSRWEGTLAEVGRLLASTGGTWAWVLDDAASLDQESLRLVEQLTHGVTTRGLVVLAVREDERAVLEPRLRLLRSSGRLRELALPAFTTEGLKALFPMTAGAAKGVALTARLLELNGRTGGSPTTAEAVVRAVVPTLPKPELTVLSMLSVCGGRLPMSGLDAVLGAPQLEVVRALEQRLLVRTGPTLRSEGALEVWLRFNGQGPAVDLGQAKGWLSAAGAWAEGVVTSAASPALKQVALPQAIRAAEAAGDVVRVSLAWELTARLGGGNSALRKAEAGAVGIRRLVVGRMLAEDELFRGEVQRAIATTAVIARHSASASVVLPSAWLRVLSSACADELERWDLLSADEALMAIELVRAEALAQLGQPHETKRAFEGLEARLQKAPPTPASAALWLRMAKSSAWFFAEVLADGPGARRICETVRRHVTPSMIASSFHTMGFLRAEQVAESRGGDATRARALADELIALSKARGETREECVGWNARGLLHLRDGELSLAKAAFERSLALARNIGFRRREAVALHNLGLALAASGEYAASLTAQERYVAISEQIGNLLARAYGPAAQAVVLVQQLESAKAEVQLGRARRAAEENGWPNLIAWARHLSGLLKLLRHLEKRDTLLLSLARSDLLASLDLVEDRHGGWSEELDPAETATLLCLTWLCAGNVAQAKAALPRAERFAEGSAASKHTVQALRDVLGGQPPTASLRWFQSTGHVRACSFWTQISQALGVPDTTPPTPTAPEPTRIAL